MKKRIMVLCMTGLILGAAPASASVETKSNIDIEAKVMNMVEGYWMGLLSGLLPFILISHIKDELKHHSTPTPHDCHCITPIIVSPKDTNDAIFSSSFATGLLSGLFVWRSAISHVCQNLTQS